MLSDKCKIYWGKHQRDGTCNATCKTEFNADPDNLCPLINGSMAEKTDMEKLFEEFEALDKKFQAVYGLGYTAIKDVRKDQIRWMFMGVRLDDYLALKAKYLPKKETEEGMKFKVVEKDITSFFGTRVPVFLLMVGDQVYARVRPPMKAGYRGAIRTWLPPTTMENATLWDPAGNITRQEFLGDAQVEISRLKETLTMATKTPKVIKVDGPYGTARYKDAVTGKFVPAPKPTRTVTKVTSMRNPCGPPRGTVETAGPSGTTRIRNIKTGRYVAA